MNDGSIFGRRSSRRQILAATAAGAASAVWLPGSLAGRSAIGGVAQAQTAEPKRGGTIIVSSNYDPGPDPQASYYFWIHGGYAETLTSINAKGEIIPFLAERWEASPDARVYTFFLREGVTFHNGRPLTADDVAWSLDRVKNPDTLATLGPQLAAVTVEAVDPRTVRLTSAQPDAALPAVVAMTLITAPESMGADGQLGKPIGTGPFVFDRYVAGQELRLTRNDAYWRPGPYLDGVVYQQIADYSARTNAVRSETVDLLLGYPPIELPLVADNPDFVVQTHAFPYPVHVAFNMANPPKPLDDVRVRRAVLLALDRQELLQSQEGEDGPGRVDNQPYGPDSVWRLGLPDPFQPRDVDAARQLLAEAGVPDGFLTTVLAYPETRLLAEVAQAQLREVGVEIEIDVSPDWATFTTKIQQYNHGFVFDGFFYWYDPAIHYGWYDPERQSFFAGGYAKPAFAQLLDEARATTDVAERKQRYVRALTLLANEDVAAVDLFASGLVAVMRSDVKDLDVGVNHLNPAEGGLRNAWLDR